jgi:hypothetical protein
MTDQEILKQVRETLLNLLTSVADDVDYFQCNDGCPEFGHCDEPLKCMANYILSLSVGEYTLRQLIELAAKAKSNDCRLAVVRTKAELPKNPLIWGQKGMEPRIIFDNAHQLMLNAGFVQEVQDYQQCTRPDVLDCHAKIGTGGRCMNGIVCPLIQEVKDVYPS